MLTYETAILYGIMIAIPLAGAALLVHASSEALEKFLANRRKHQLDLESMRVRESLEMLSLQQGTPSVHCPKCGRFSKLIASHPAWTHIWCHEHEELVTVSATAEILGTPVVTNNTVVVEVMPAAILDTTTGVITLPETLGDPLPELVPQ